MPKNRNILVIIVCLVLLSVISLLTWAILQTRQLESAAQELAVAATREAFLARYPATLVEYSHPDFQDIMPTEELVRYLENSQRQLGSLNSMVSIRGSVVIPSIPTRQTTGSAEFEIELDFQNAPANVIIEMEMLDGYWLITGFTLTANQLMD